MYKFTNKTPISLVLETELKGVRRVAEAVAEDFSSVFGYKPLINGPLSEAEDGQTVNKVVCKLEAESFPVTAAREQFAYKFEDNTLYILGSDKRGLIYGMFTLSELIGVSPLVWWGDIRPCLKSQVEIKEEDLLVKKLTLCAGTYLSPRPSVKYRGFFINDEWPAFGNWCNEKFGGFNAKVYEQVFLLLLRLKGNYMWPAMWSATFSEDGPGLLNAELADELGVIMGASHHEPMCRAGEEWQHIYKQYGDDNTWSFVTNQEAITKFWKDGVNRNKSFENIITIGMRGEADSKLLGENATIEDNINVVKAAITTQHRLIRENVNPELGQVPRMLAIYKEVEDYYYGAEGVPGLRDWEELKDVIFLLCEDNHGNLRGLPEEKDRQTHTGGYGMYYHFDYHGAPISYEWVNCVNLQRTREQMRTAYEYGVKDLWIVNVGDLKAYEYPLQYFMELAYSYEAGMDGNSVEEFTNRFFDQLCAEADRATANDLIAYVEGFTKWNNIRKPEHLNPHIFNPVNYKEGSFVYESVKAVYELGESLHKRLEGRLLEAFESMFYYAGQASLNLIMMNVCAGLNETYYKLNNKKANALADEVKERIEADKAYVAAFHSFNKGKWNHMMDSAHTNFVTWNDQGWSYPTPLYVEGQDSKEEPGFTLDSDISIIECDEYTALVSVDETEGPAWTLIPDLGRLGCGLKAYPYNRSFEDVLGSVYAEYSFETEADEDYTIEFTFMARNPVVKGGPHRFAYAVDGGEPELTSIVRDDYYTEWTNKEWNEGVMSGARTVSRQVKLTAGSHTLRIYPYDPNVIFERMIVHKTGFKLPASYLGARL